MKKLLLILALIPIAAIAATTINVYEGNPSKLEKRIAALEAWQAQIEATMEEIQESGQ